MPITRAWTRLGAVAALLVLALAVMVVTIDDAAVAVSGPVPGQDTGPLLTPEPEEEETFDLVESPEAPVEDPESPGTESPGTESPGSESPRTENENTENQPGEASDGAPPGPALIAGYVLLVAAGLVLTVVSAAALWSMLYAWRSRAALPRTGFVRSSAGPARRFSVLVPAGPQPELLAAGLERLTAQDHPDLQIIAIVGHDDDAAEAAARSVAERHPDRVDVVVDHSVIGNRASALNRALPAVRGDVVGVVAATDLVHPHLLTQVDRMFVATSAHVVQGGVRPAGSRRSWWSLQHELDQYLWYRSRVHVGADHGIALLGGGTSFIDADWLHAAGGWAEDCAAEDCELGIRLSADGARVAAAYEPALVTRVPAPPSLRVLVKERAELERGLRQVRRRRAWQELPSRRARSLAKTALAMPAASAAVGVLVPLSVAAALLLELPTAVAMMLLLPAAPWIVARSVEIAALGDPARASDHPARAWDYPRLVLGAIPYRLVLALAAVRSLFRARRIPVGAPVAESSATLVAALADDPETAPMDLFELGPEVEVQADVEPGPEPEPAIEREAEPDLQVGPEPEPEPDGEVEAPQRRHVPVAAPARGVDETPTAELALGRPAGASDQHARLLEHDRSAS